MKSQGKQAKFFCENCNEEVKQNDRFCKKCGRFFSAVRCPACGKVGSSNMFANGCPACGYAEKSKNKKSSNKNSKIKNFNNGKNHFYIRHPFVKSRAQNNESFKNKKFQKENSSLPIWIYCVTFCVLIFMIAFLCLMGK